MTRALITTIMATVKLSASTIHVGATSTSSNPVAWGVAKQIPGLASLNVGGSSKVSSISCATAGNCAAGGTYATSFGRYGTSQGFVVDEHDGTWGTAQEIPGLAALNVGDNASAWSISCVGAGDCAEVGGYETSRNPYVLGEQGFVVDETHQGGHPWKFMSRAPGLLFPDTSDSCGSMSRTVVCNILSSPTARPLGRSGSLRRVVALASPASTRHPG